MFPTQRGHREVLARRRIAASRDMNLAVGTCISRVGELHVHAPLGLPLVSLLSHDSRGGGCLVKRRRIRWIHRL